MRGQPYHIIHPDKSIEKKTYTLDGLLKTETAPNGVTTVYQYDALGRIISTQCFDKEKQDLKNKPKLLKEEDLKNDSKMLYETKTSYNAFHKLSETDAMGHLTTYQYDAAGRLIHIENGDLFTEYSYDFLGRIAKTKTPDIILEQDYDLLDRVVEERTFDHSNQLLKKVGYGYDVDGNCQEQIFYNETGKVITTTLYNAYSQPETITDPQKHQTHTLYHYDGETARTETIDPLGNVTEIICDAHGRPSLVLRKDAENNILQEQHLFYDPNGNSICTHEILPEKKKRITRRTYDCMNRLIFLQEACETKEETTTQVYYNTFGQKIRHEQPNKISLSYEYDLLNRLIRMSSSDQTIDYGYSYNLNDQVTEIKDEISGTKTTREYDQNGWMIQETLGNGLTIKYAYEKGALKTVTYPDQSQVVYNTQGCFVKEVQRIKKDKTYTHTYDSYDLSGNVLQSTLAANQGQLAITLDSLSQPIGIKTSFTDQTFAYNAIGDLIKLATANAATRKFDYDPLSQLIAEDGHTYAYDSQYNCIQKDKNLHKYNALNQLLKDGRFHYLYDANGNLIEKSSKRTIIKYTYDALNRLTSITQNNQTTFYQYDSNNRRLSKQTGGITTRYLYQDDCEVGSYDEQGNAIEFRALGIGLGAEIGTAVLLELNDKTYIPLHDHNGNVTVLIDAATSQPIETYTYTAFGEESHTNHLNPWRFSSKRFDPESGLIYFGNRYYDPSIGRFITRDPIGIEDGPNLYAYVHNNPLTSIDTFGLFDDSFWDTPFIDYKADYSFIGDLSSNVWGSFTTRCHDFRYGLDTGRSMNIESWRDSFSSACSNNNYSYAMGLTFGNGLGTCQRFNDFFQSFRNNSYPDMVYGELPLPGKGFSGNPTLSSATRPAVKMATSTTPTIQLNQFHQAAYNLTNVGKNNIRILRNWAESKGWKKLPNPNGAPEKWGIYK